MRVIMHPRFICDKNSSFRIKFAPIGNEKVLDEAFSSAIPQLKAFYRMS